MKEALEAMVLIAYMLVYSLLHACIMFLSMYLCDVFTCAGNDAGQSAYLRKNSRAPPGEKNVSEKASCIILYALLEIT